METRFGIWIPALVILNKKGVGKNTDGTMEAGIQTDGEIILGRGDPTIIGKSTPGTMAGDDYNQDKAAKL